MPSTMRLTRILCLAVFLLAAGAPAPAQTSRVSSIPVARLEARIPALLDSAGIPGLSIAVLEHGEIVWSGAFGERSALTHAPVDGETVFEAASLTKPLFAYTVLGLAERGAIDLDRPLSSYRPMTEFSHDPRIDAVTARMILTHLSGISGFADDGTLTFGADPGERFRYFGDARLPLQRAVEAITGEPVDQWVARTILAPFGMTRSSLVWEGRFENDYAMPHDELGRPRGKRRFAEAHVAATLQTTARDYARFLIAAMRGAGLQARTATTFLTPQVEVAPGVSWGIGVGLQQDSRGLALWQWGHGQGTRAYAIAYPETGAGVVFLANGDGGLSILNAILGTAFGPDQPGASWLAYEQFDAPGRAFRFELLRTFVAEGTASGMARMGQIESGAGGSALGEATLNRLGYDLLAEGLLEAAIAVFERNVERFPASSNVYDSLGEAYLAAGRLEPALENYRRSVELDPTNDNGRQAMERIRTRMGATP